MPLDHCQRKAGWRWLVRQARDWELRQRLQQADTEAAAPRTIPPQIIDGFLLQPICTRLELWEEATTLRHCAFLMLDSVIDGRCLQFSIRRARGPGQRLATVEILREDGAWGSDRSRVSRTRTSIHGSAARSPRSSNG